MKHQDASRPHIVVVGAGPGGLTAAMILSHRGCKVTVFEKEAVVGGRNAELRLGPYSFDTGPTFLMMKFLLDEMFEEAGRSTARYMECRELDPMYELCFGDFSVFPTSNREKMRSEIERVFPGENAGFDRFMDRERHRFLKMYPCLQKDYSSLGDMVAPVLLKALPHLSLGKSLYQVLSGYFSPEALRLSFTFQSKYLGMSPWSCPGAFTIIPYIEYGFGVYHVMGGLCKICHGMAQAAQEDGAEIHLSTPVKKLLVQNKVVKGVQLESGETIQADSVIINADFSHAMTQLVEQGVLRKYTTEKLRNRDFSCSTFMLYLGVDRSYDLQHHTIYFAKDYRRNLEEIAHKKILSKDISFYVRNATVTDPNLAPAGHSALYILVPVPNNQSGIDWDKEGPIFRDHVLHEIVERTLLKDLPDHIQAEEIITPWDWERKRSVFLGATFNLAHTLGQMLYLRPRNAFEELGNCYLVGGGTHPGSGVPTILESGRISANLISKKMGLSFRPPKPLVLG